MTTVLLLGYLAALASMASFVPQAWRIIRSRQTKSVSAGTYMLTVSAFGLWLVYGVLLRHWPMVVSNAVCFGLSAFILVMIPLPQPRKDKVAAALKGKTR